MSSALTDWGGLAVTVPAPLAELLSSPPATKTTATPATAGTAAPQAGQRPRRARASEAPLITIRGVLADDAQWRVTTGERAVGIIVLCIDQGGAVSIRASQIVGTDPLAHMAAIAKVRTLRRGAQVVVEGAQLAAHPNSRVVELLGVSRIDTTPVRAWHEPQESSDADH